ncbi:MAG: MBL fold metallo-hydrolase [Acidimicrobiia bacterium]|nr:MBL fold metallo-hydrolase [Acidimicrobiia bacterium]
MPFRRRNTKRSVTAAPDPGALSEIADGILVWGHPVPGNGRANCGVVVEDDWLIVIDAGMVPSQSAAFSKALSTFGRPIRHLVLTHAHIEHCGGTASFPLAAIYGSPATSQALDLPPSIAAYQAFMPDYARELAGFADHPPRPVSHVVDGPARLSSRVELLPATGHTAGDLIALVDGDAVAFTGGLINNGVAPLGFQSLFETWAGTARLLADLADLVVPAEGPPGPATVATIFADYLSACLAARGDVAALQPGPWDEWAEAQFRNRVNVERAQLSATGSVAISPTMLRALGVL